MQLNVSFDLILPQSFLAALRLKVFLLSLLSTQTARQCRPVVVNAWWMTKRAKNSLGSQSLCGFNSATLLSTTKTRRLPSRAWSRMTWLAFTSAPAGYAFSENLCCDMCWRPRLPVWSVPRLHSLVGRSLQEAQGRGQEVRSYLCQQWQQRDGLQAVLRTHALARLPLRWWSHHWVGWGLWCRRHSHPRVDWRQDRSSHHWRRSFSHC